MKGNLNSIINGELPVLIDFHATWCGPCKTQSIIIKDLAKEVKGRIRIIKIDIDKNPRIAQRFNVRGVPTLSVFKSGKLVWQESGVHTKPQLLNVINEYV